MGTINKRPGCTNAGYRFVFCRKNKRKSYYMVLTRKSFHSTESLSSDSAYVHGMIHYIDTATICTNQEELFHLFYNVQFVIWSHQPQFDCSFVVLSLNCQEPSLSEKTTIERLLAAVTVTSSDAFNKLKVAKHAHHILKIQLQSQKGQSISLQNVHVVIEFTCQYIPILYFLKIL